MSSPPRRMKKPLSHVGRPGVMRFEGDGRWRNALERAFRPPEGFDERALTHGFHAWPARLHPFIARTLIPLAPAGAAIADPFMGGGTTPLEALLAGRLAVGGDLNPVGLEVAWTRTRRSGPPLVGRAKALAREAEGLVGQPLDPTFARSIGDWFDPVALAEVYALRTVVLRSLEARPDDVGRILRAVLSSILVKLSRQVSDSVTRIARPDPRGAARSPRERVFHWFIGRAAELEGQLRDLARAIPARSGAPIPEPRLTLGDARRAPADLPPVGAVITSPPYPGVYDYLRHHMVRMTVLGFDLAEPARAEIGARRAHEREGREIADRRYVEDMAAVLQSWSSTLVPGAFWALVVGDGQAGPAVVPVLPLIAEAARKAGLDVAATLSDPRPTFGPGSHGVGGGHGGAGGQRQPARQTGAPKDEHLVILTRAASPPAR